MNMKEKKKISWFFKKRSRNLIGEVIAYIIVGMGSVVLLIPFAWMISTALKEPGVIFTFPLKWIPHPVVWHNFIEAWTSVPFGTFLKNTCIITFSCIIGQVLSGSLVAYGFARLRFPGRNVLFIILLSTIMIPYQVTMIPQFILFNYLGWIDTFKPLIVPFFFGGSAFYIFLLRQFFLTISPEMDDAAKIDGCTLFGIYYRIILPLSKPALGIIAIFSFAGHWNAFVLPLIFLSSMEKFTLALGLNFFRGMYLTEWNLLMAATLLVILPCLLLFFFAQKYFIQGIVITGLKG